MTIYIDDNSNLLAKLFFIDVVLTIIVFGFSYKLGNGSVYDPYWSVIPFFMLFYWYYYSDISFLTPQILLTFLVVSIYSWRLTFNWVRRWHGLGDEDWRYSMLSQKTGKWYPIVNFLGIHLFPTVVVFIASIPLYYLIVVIHPFSVLNYIGVVVALFGVWIEWLADYQLHEFKVTNNNKIAVMRFGIWKYIRHPNYLGEISFWFGLGMMGMSDFMGWPLFIGAAIILFMFMFISIPMMQKRLLVSKPGYDDYVKSSWKLIPYIF